MKKSILVAFLVLASIFTVITILPERARATTLYVGGAGPGNYTTIQGAIDGANPVDTVFVYNGTYYENVVINKSVSLVGESKNSTIIDAGGNGSAVQVWWTHHVNLTGLSATNSGSGSDAAGIRLHLAENCVVSGNTASGNQNGILLLASHANTIDNNTVSQNVDNGVSLSHSRWNDLVSNMVSDNMIGMKIHDYSEENRFINNDVWNNLDGVYVISSSRNEVTGNTVFSNTAFGIRLSYSSRNKIVSNTVSDNRDGIEVSSSDMNTIANNNVSSNDGLGIEVDSSDNNTVVNNTVSSNAHIGITLWGCSNSSVYHNNIIENEKQAVDFTLETNYWDDGYPSGGNYWSDYTGVDRRSGAMQDQRGADGIGDAPYDIKTGIIRYPNHEETRNKDHYPLMSPFVPPPLSSPNELPVCTIADPPSGTNVSGTYTIRGSASDLDGLVERVEIRVDDGEWIRVIGTASWRLDWETTALSNGNHAILAQSYDGTDYSDVTSVRVTINNPARQESIFEEPWFWAVVIPVVVVVVTAAILEWKGRKNDGEEPEE